MTGAIVSADVAFELSSGSRGEIVELSKADAPNEACGVVVSRRGAQVVIHTGNANDEPEEGFAIAGADWREIENRGDEIVAIWHSHPGGPAELSERDLKTCEFLEIPWVVCEPDSESVVVHRPEPSTPPLVGRIWRWGHCDCFALVKDYYAAEGFALENFERPDPFPPGEPDYLEQLALRLGFTETDELQPGDLLLMKIRGTQPNHLAIYVGQSEILHHLVDSLSRRETYDARWRRVTTHRFRRPGA